MPVILITNARIYCYDASSARFVRHGAILLDGARIVALDPRGVPLGAVVNDAAGATIVAAFTDAHVHLADTGYVTGTRNLRWCRSYDDYWRAIERAPVEDGLLYCGQFDDAAWTGGRVADRAPLERFHGDVRAFASRIDAHSCIVNRRLFGELRLPAETAGIERDANGEPTGRLIVDANWLAQAHVAASFSTRGRRAAERRAAELALSRGAVHLHAQLLGDTLDGYADTVASFAGLPLDVHAKICEPDAAIAQRLGLRAIGGDVFLDGSLGSLTAALHRCYEGRDSSGALRYDDDELFAYFDAAEAAGIAAGVHAIGDAAIDQCVRVWTRVFAHRAPSGTRHFIEHFELAGDASIAACARYGIVLSMQPQFDASWGGDSGMYVDRLGRERASRMNRLRDILNAGAVICGGDDSPVCELDPLAGMQAAIAHRTASQRMSVHEALALYTVCGAYFGGQENGTGNLLPGMSADLVWLDGDPFERNGFAGLEVLQTWHAGEPAYVRG